MANNVTLVGRITKDLELKKTPGQNSVSVCSFTLAVNRTFASQSGEKQADFIRCVAWRMTAENLAKYQGKGSLISVIGRIQTTSKEVNGKREYFTEVVAENVQFLESKKSQESKGQQQGSQQGNYNNQQQVSQQGNYDNQQQQGSQQGNYGNNYGGSQQQGGQQGNYGNQQSNYGGQQQGYGNQQSYVPAGSMADDDLPF